MEKLDIFDKQCILDADVVPYTLLVPFCFNQAFFKSKAELL